MGKTSGWLVSAEELSSVPRRRGSGGMISNRAFSELFIYLSQVHRPFVSVWLTGVCSVSFLRTNIVLHLFQHLFYIKPYILYHFWNQIFKLFPLVLILRSFGDFSAYISNIFAIF